MVIEAVIWDFGGVFTTSPFEAFNRFEQSRGAPRDHIRRVNAANPDANAWALFERAEIDAAGFDKAFAAIGAPFRLLALDAEPGLRAGLTLWQLLELVEPTVLGMNRLVGTYTEPRR